MDIIHIQGSVKSTNMYYHICTSYLFRCLLLVRIMFPIRCTVITIRIISTVDILALLIVLIRVIKTVGGNTFACAVLLFIWHILIIKSWHYNHLLSGVPWVSFCPVSRTSFQAFTSPCDFVSLTVRPATFCDHIVRHFRPFCNFFNTSVKIGFGINYVHRINTVPACQWLKCTKNSTIIRIIVLSYLH